VGKPAKVGLRVSLRTAFCTEVAGCHVAIAREPLEVGSQPNHYSGSLAKIKIARAACPKILS
jgi:hypothetical protein